MVRFLLISLLFVSFPPVYSQDSAGWNIILNKKSIFSARQEDEQKNILTVKVSDFKAGKNFIISYLETSTARNKNEWKRTIGIYNTADKELIRKDTATLKLNASQIKKWLLENKTVKVYTWSLPKDPKEAARVRIRRVHLCTIVLK